MNTNKDLQDKLTNVANALNEIGGEIIERGGKNYFSIKSMIAELNNIKDNIDTSPEKVAQREQKQKHYNVLTKVYDAAVWVLDGELGEFEGYGFAATILTKPSKESPITSLKEAIEFYANEMREFLRGCGMETWCVRAFEEDYALLTDGEVEAMS